jgi:ribosomal protein S18 acetylase RimI-like enzyme
MMPVPGSPRGTPRVLRTGSAEAFVDVLSPAIRSDFIFARFDGEVHDRGGHVLVRTPANPGFWWGNYLVFPNPPGPGDVKRWRAVFAEEFAGDPGVLHEAYAWEPTDGSTGAAEDFVAEGFELDLTVAQTLTPETLTRPCKWNDDVEVRPIRMDAESDQVLAAHLARSPPEHDPASFAAFLERQWTRYRRMIDAGLGLWHGAFLEGELVADMGIFVEDRLARCQAVGTAPKHRRKGICGTLMHGACRHAFEEQGAEQVLLMADETYHAAGIYRTVGFRDTEKVRDLTHRPPKS